MNRKKAKAKRKIRQYVIYQLNRQRNYPPNPGPIPVFKKDKREGKETVLTKLVTHPNLGELLNCYLMNGVIGFNFNLDSYHPIKA